MLGRFDVGATVATRDLARARRFYEEALGLKVAEDMGEALVLKSGATQLLLYVSEYAGMNNATAATWNVGGDIDRVVRDLAAKGLAFEHYDLPGARREGDIHVTGPLRLAWLKDPDGNVLALAGG